MKIYDTNSLLDTVSEQLRTKNDAALSRALDVTPGEISKLRHGKRMGATMILRIHDAVGMDIKQIKRYLQVTA